MKKIWVQQPDNNRINYKCRNMHELCSYWAVDECGDDDPNVEYMRDNCAPACQTCHLLDSQLRCPKEESECIIKPGGLNALFEKIVDPTGSGEYQKYNPIVYSRPKLKADGTPAPGVEKDGPWIVVLQNFITDKEADADHGNLSDNSALMFDDQTPLSALKEGMDETLSTLQPFLESTLSGKPTAGEKVLAVEIPPPGRKPPPGGKEFPRSPVASSAAPKKPPPPGAKPTAGRKPPRVPDGASKGKEFPKSPVAS